MMRTYLLAAEGSVLTKIGRAAHVGNRVAQLQTGQPMTLTVLLDSVGDYEAALHGRFDAQRVRGEWFDLTVLGDPVRLVLAALAALAALAEMAATPPSAAAPQPLLPVPRQLPAPVSHELSAPVPPRPPWSADAFGPDPGGASCRWCGAPVHQGNTRTSRLYCKRAHRQRAFEAERLGLPMLKDRPPAQAPVAPVPVGDHHQCGWCREPLVRQPLGRPVRYCSAGCKQRAYEARKVERAVRAARLAEGGPDQVVT
ncbi:GIY-YIG nuclease family protein [Streptomyces sp. NBC_01276]|uniref:GIY-YIG nuclease family protein n=1 Tax=Streptomyces sp. NBC_01276 TaxID=2903808 RepID=UPI00352C71DE